MEAKEAPIPAASNDSIPACTNGRSVYWNMQEYKVIPGDTLLGDGRMVADMAIGEVAALADNSGVVERCRWEGNRAERLSRMACKEPRNEMVGLPAVSFAQADARGEKYVTKHAKVHKEDIITCMEVMGVIPCAPMTPGVVSYIHNGQNYVIRMFGRGDYNYYIASIEGVQTWAPQSNNLWQRVLYTENGDEIGVESVAEYSSILVGNVDDCDWDYFNLQCKLLGLTVQESAIGR